jgi:hypothetical protein
MNMIYKKKTNFTLKDCALNNFKCNNGECINSTSRCDQSIDCRDGSDEQNCPRNNF